MFPLKTHSLILRRQLWSITLSSKMSNEKSKPYIICFLWTRRYNQPFVCCWFASREATLGRSKGGKGLGKGGAKHLCKVLCDSIQGITSLLSAAWAVVAGWSASLGSFMRPAGPWKCFWRTWSGARSPTPSAPSGDCHRHGRGRRSPAPGPNPLQLQRLSFPTCPQELDFFCDQLSFTLHQSCKGGLYH